jgi:hypothetical protein
MTNPNDSSSFSLKENEVGYGNCVTLYLADGSKQFINFEKGNTKYEEAHLRFMCAFVQGLNANHTVGKLNYEGIAEESTKLTNAYFNELNKEK